MRLINSTSRELKHFVNKSIPTYAILSHTWIEDEEVSFQDYQITQIYPEGCGNATADAIRSRLGFSKIKRCCEQALRDGLDWVWIDTCCIDKTSSTELSEAINSMFQWYKKSELCYALLSDVQFGSGDLLQVHSGLKSSRYFTRGWTLQELLAPTQLQMFDGSWNHIGELSKDISFTETISSITGIPSEFLHGQDLRFASISQKMSWAAWRNTTRQEDMAYCLLGLFNVQMALLYGEGDKAFARLQEEIIKSNDDQTILAWGCIANPMNPYSHAIRNVAVGILATSPRDFADSGFFAPIRGGKKRKDPFVMTNQGLRIRVKLAPDWYPDRIRLQCYDTRHPKRAVYIRFKSSDQLSHPPRMSVTEGSALTRFGNDLQIELPSSLLRQSRGGFFDLITLCNRLSGVVGAIWERPGRSVFLDRGANLSMKSTISVAFPPGLRWKVKHIEGSTGQGNDLIVGPTGITCLPARDPIDGTRRSIYIHLERTHDASGRHIQNQNDRTHDLGFILMVQWRCHAVLGSTPIVCKLVRVSNDYPESLAGDDIVPHVEARGTSWISIRRGVITTTQSQSISETTVTLLLSDNFVDLARLWRPTWSFKWILGPWILHPITWCIGPGSLLIWFLIHLYSEFHRGSHLAIPALPNSTSHISQPHTIDR